MSKNKSPKPCFVAPEYFSLDFEHDRYEMLETPTLQKLCLPPEGSLHELEESACILPESLRAFLRDRESLFELYGMGIEGNSELHQLMYVLSADMTQYLPVSVTVVFKWDEASRTVKEATGKMMIVREIPVANVRHKERKIA